MKHISRILVVFCVAALVPMGVLRAHAADASPVQKAIEGVKETLDNLVTAKDEKTIDQVAPRIDTFGKVIDFSLKEAKDLKVSLLGLDTKDKATIAWRDDAVKQMDAALKYYQDQKDWLSDNDSTLDLEGIKSAAKKFKEWRDANYVETAGQINDYLLIQQETAAIKTAQKRLQKIGSDLKTITKSRTKKATELTTMLAKADATIRESVRFNGDANAQFRTTFLLPLLATSTPTSTSAATDTLPMAVPPVTTSTPTSTAAAAPLPPPSIRDLAKASLEKIRDAYQIFIDMSNSVRGLLP